MHHVWVEVIEAFCTRAACASCTNHVSQWLDVFCRPYRVPLPNWAVTLMLVPAGALLLTILALPIARGDWQMMAWTGGCIVVGLLLYPFLQTAREREWFEFVGVSPHDFQTNLYASLPVVTGSDLNSRPVINGAPVMTADELHVGQAQEPLVATPPAPEAEAEQGEELQL